jgi:hypothetical protein
VDESLLAQKQQRHADVLDDLHLAAFVQAALAEVVGVVFEVDLPVGEGLHYLAVAEVLGDIGADLVAHVLQEIALILKRNVDVSLPALQADLPHQAAVLHDCLVLVPLGFHWHHVAVDADLRDVAVDAVDDLCVPASADDGFLGLLLDLDGGEDELRALLLPVGEV